jgi:hypothetical protein
MLQKTKKILKFAKITKKDPSPEGEGIGLVTDLVTDCAHNNTINHQ